MLRMGKRPDSEEPDSQETTPSTTAPNPAPAPSRQDGAYVAQPGQKVQPDRDPYRLVGAEITTADYERLRLLRYVGAGGMGAVFYAVSPVRGPLAIKILKPDIIDRFPEYVDLFSREIAAVKSLDHPNIVKFVGHGRTIQGYPFIAVEWLSGATLDQHLISELPIRTVLTLFEQIGSAIAAAHKLKIIHLDLKPENIFVVSTNGLGEGLVKVIDFGISRILSTYSGTTVTRFGGSLHYCSPEHFGGRVSPRSDIFSLGVLLYHILTGLLPIGASYISAKQLGRELPQLPALTGQDPDITPGLERVVKKAVNRDPSERHQCVEELMEDLRSVLAPSWRNEFEIEPAVFKTEPVQEAIQEWLRRDFSVFAYDSYKARTNSLEYYPDFVVSRVPKDRYYWRISDKDILSEVTVERYSKSTERLLMNILTHSLSEFKRILVVVAHDAIAAHLAAKQIIPMTQSILQPFSIVTGWYSLANKVFYPVIATKPLKEFLGNS